MTSPQIDLRSRWRRFAAKVGGDVETSHSGRLVVETTFDLLEGFYKESGRHYHTLAHISWCLDLLDEFFPYGNMVPAFVDRVELALFFHDVIYDPKRKDNEKRSADMLIGCAAMLGLDPKWVREVAFDVECTTHTIVWTRPPCPEPTRWVLDLDLASLGFAPEKFDENSAQIREEYSFVPEDAFMAGRKTVLQGFLGRPRLYLTPECHDRFEGQARDNLKRAIAALG